MFRSAHHLLCLVVSTASFGSAYTDSLRLVADRLGERSAHGGHTTVAVIGVNEEAAPALSAEIVSELTFHLVNQQSGTNVVERAQLDVLLREHQFSAAGMTTSAYALQLGELACASAIITVQVQPKDKRQVLVELKLLNTTTGLLEGMERVLVAVPHGFDGPEHPSGSNEQHPRRTLDPRRGGFYIGGGIGESYCGIHPFAQVDLLTRGERIALGLRLRLMPEAANGIPTRVDLGRLHSSGPLADPFGVALVPSAIAEGGGDAVHLVTANDPTFGALAVLAELDKGAAKAQWEQIKPIEFSATRWSFMAPIRLYWGPRTHHRGPVVHTEVGIGADIYSINSTYAVTRIIGTKVGGEAEFLVDRYNSKGPFNDQRSNTALFWNAAFGIGVEWGRLGVTMGGQRSLHRTFTNTFTDPFMNSSNNAKVVHGDPIAIALLNGAALDEAYTTGTIARDGSVLFGTIDATDLNERFSTMESLLDRWQWNATLAIRLF